MKVILTELAKASDKPNQFIPKQGTPESAGYDIRACIVRSMTIFAGECVRIPLGFHCHIDNASIAALILPRSGLGATHGIVLGNLVGLIDADYQQECQCAVWNRNMDGTIVINPADKLAQVIFVPVLQPQFTVVGSFEKTTVRTGGFGSTDILI